MGISQHAELLPALANTVRSYERLFDNIPDTRRKILLQLASFIQQRTQRREQVYLNFICTHNSRRSHVAQIWAQTAAYYYGVTGVQCLSGGTEATSFNSRAVTALIEVGFAINGDAENMNPVYNVVFAADQPAIKAFSKNYDDATNTVPSFAAIMTCSDADDKCPLIIGAAERFPIHYEDPKAFDGSSNEARAYSERVEQIGIEMLFCFSNITPPNLSL